MLRSSRVLRAPVLFLALFLTLAVAPAVHGLPVITASPESGTFSPGETINLSVTATGDGLTYQWRRNGIVLTGETGATLAVADAAVGDAGLYDVVVTDATGSVRSEPARMNVDAAMEDLQGIRILSASRTLDDAEKCWIALTIEGSGTASLLLRGVGPTLTQLGITSAMPDPMIRLLSPEGQVLAENDNWAVDADHKLAVEEAASAVAAFPLTDFGDSEDNDAVLVADVEPGRYVVELVGEDGGFALIEIYANGASAPTTRVTSMGFYEPEWGQGGNDRPRFAVVTGSEPHDYLTRSVQVGVETGSGGTSPRLEVYSNEGPSSVVDLFQSWTESETPVGFFGAVGALPLSEGSPDLSTTVELEESLYNVRGSGPSRLLEVYDLVNATPAAAPEQILPTLPLGDLASGDDVFLRPLVVGAAPLTYVWRHNGEVIEGETGPTLERTDLSGLDGGDYEVTVSNSHGSLTLPMGTVDLPVPPVITLSPSATSALGGDEVTFTVEAFSTAELSYQWFRGGEEIAGATGATLTLSNVAAADLGDYTVQVSNTHGSVTTEAVALSPGGAPPLVSITPDTVNASVGDNVTLTANTDAASPVFQWYRNGFEMTGETGGQLELSAVTMRMADRYTVVVIDDVTLGNAESAAARLTVHPANIPDIMIADPTWQVDLGGGFWDVLGMVPAPGRGTLVVGTFRSVDGHSTNDVVLLDPDGEVDRSFSMPDLFPVKSSVMKGKMEVLESGQVLLVNAPHAVPGRQTGRLIRLNADGSVDATFQQDARLDTAYPHISISTFALADGGAVFVGGSYPSAVGADPLGVVLKLDADGSWDETFSSPEFAGSPNHLVARSDGGVWVAHDGAEVGGVPVHPLVRLTSSGTLDTGFNDQLDFSDWDDPSAIPLLSSAGGVYVQFASSSYKYRLVLLGDDGSENATWKLSTGLFGAGALSSGDTVFWGNTGTVDDVEVGQVFALSSTHELRSVPARPSDVLLMTAALVDDRLNIFSRNNFDTGRTTNSWDFANDSSAVWDVEFEGGGVAYDVVQLNTGEWLVGGAFDYVDGQATDGLVRLTADGAVSGTYENLFVGDGSPVELSRRSDGQIDILASSFGTPPNLMLRLHPNGDLNVDYVIDSRLSGASKSDLLSLPGGRTVVSGWYIASPTRHIVFFEDDGSMIETFERTTSEHAFLGGFVNRRAELVTFTTSSVHVQKRDRDGIIIETFGDAIDLESFPAGIAEAVDESIWLPTHLELKRVDASGSILLANNANLNFYWQWPFTRANAQLVALPDGDLLAAGYLRVSDQQVPLGAPVVRFNADASVDEEFQLLGVKDVVTAMELTDEGNLLLAVPGSLFMTTTPDQISPIVQTATLADEAVPGGNLTLRIGGLPEGDYTYQWRRDGEDIPGSTGPELFLEGIDNSDTGTYDVVIGGSLGPRVAEGFMVAIPAAFTPGLLQPDSDWVVTLERNGIEPRAVIPTADGGFFIAGNFNSVDGHPTRGVAKISHNGTVDTTFTAEIDSSDALRDFALQPDGKLVVGGAEVSSGGMTWKGLFRLNADGTVDNEFLGGRDDVGRDVSAWDLALSPTGDIFFAGSVQLYGDTTIAVAKADANGVLDLDFAPRFTQVGEPYVPIDLEVLESDRLVVVGSFDKVNGVHRRLAAVLDFSGAMVAEAQPDIPDIVSNSNPTNLVRSPTGEVIFAANYLESPTTGASYHRLVTIPPEGGPVGLGDPLDIAPREIASDAGGGIWFTTGYDATAQVMHLAPGAVEADRARATPGINTASVVQLSDGSLVVVGTPLGHPVDPQSGIFVFDTSGSAQTEFDVQFRNGASANHIVAQPDGSLLIVGYFEYINGVRKPYLARITADGELDHSFPANGMAPNAPVVLSARRSDGKVYLAGAFTEYGGVSVGPVLRLNPDGSLDTGFDLSPSSTLILNGNPASLTTAMDGGVYLGGWFRDNSLRGNPGAVRFLPNGVQYPDSYWTEDGEPKRMNATYAFIEYPEKGYFMGGYGELEHFGLDLELDDAFSANQPTISYFADIARVGEHLLIPHFEGFARLDLEGHPVSGYQHEELSFGWGYQRPSGRVFTEAAGGVLLAGAVKRGPDLDWAVDVVRLNPDGSIDESVRLLGERWTLSDIEQGMDARFYYSVTGAIRRTRPFVPTLPIVNGVSPDLTAEAGSQVELTVDAVGAGELVFQWQKDGVNIDGATARRLDLGEVSVGQAGRYTVSVSNSLGTAVSEEIWVHVNEDLSAMRGLVNWSARVSLTEESSAFAPFRIQGDTTKLVLLRVVGPSLESFGVSGFVPDPKLRLLDVTGALIAEVDNWTESPSNKSAVSGATSEVSAFALNETGADAATVALLEPGSYILEAIGDQPGTVLMEIFDVDAQEAEARLVYFGAASNYSASEPFIAGVSLASPEGINRNVVLRALGPDLTISDPLERATATLFQAGNQLNFDDRWTRSSSFYDLTDEFVSVGATIPERWSYDAAMLEDLLEGAYTLELGTNDPSNTGYGMLEIFDFDGITPPQSPFVLIPPQGGTFTVGDEVSFGVYAGGVEPLSFQWQLDGNDLPGMTSALLEFSSVEEADAGDYRVVITNSAGELVTATTRLVVNPVPVAPAITREPTSLTILAGTEAMLSVETSGTTPLAYQWFEGAASDTSAPVVGATAARFDSTPLEASTSFWVRISNSAGSIDSATATITVLPSEGPRASHQTVGSGYVAGGTVSIRNTFHFDGVAGAVGWTADIPSGWSFASAQGDAVPGVLPAAGTTGTVEFAYVSPPASGSQFTYTLNVPEGTEGTHQISASFLFRPSGEAEEVITATPAPLLLNRRPHRHAADIDGDMRLSLSELLRVIELYNTRYGTTRTGRYRVKANTEDGFGTEPTVNGSQPATISRFHTADTDKDAKLSLSELLRVIELYNTRSGTSRTGAYRVAEGTVDGFEAGE